MSLNSNDAQIFARHGAEWTLTETLSEVRISIHIMEATYLKSIYNQSARQNHHIHRLGPELQPHRHCIAGQERLRVATDSRRRDGETALEAYLSAA